MKFGKSFFTILAVSMLAALAACGGGNNNNNNNKNPISVSLGTPPASVAESASASFTATVTNDTANAGVTWTATCGSANCGAFTNNQSASGTANTYTAPSTIPSGGVTITATSVTDTTKNATASVTITAASTLADGTYVFSLAGQNVAGGYLYYAAGAFTVASGAVTGGEQDFVDYNISTRTDTITGGSVSTTADGNVQIVLNTGDTEIGPAGNGTETLNGTLVSGVRGLITEFDASATSSGELDLQTATSAGQGSFAFFLNGGDSSGCPANFGGVVDEDGAGTVSGTGSVVDISDCGFTLQAGDFDSDSTIGTPDSFGRVEVSLDLTTSASSGLGVAGYIVDGNRIRLVEDNQNAMDLFFGVMGGTAFAQGTNAGTFSAASVEGTNFVFSTNGQESNTYLQVAGVIDFGADGTTATGTLNFNDLICTCIVSSPQAPMPFQGTYSIDTTGRVTLTNLTDGSNFHYNFQLYLDGYGHGVITSLDGADITGGFAYPQSGSPFSASSFSGNYGLDATGYGGTSVYGPEIDAVGPTTSDGVSAVTGTVDLNIQGGTAAAGLPLTDGYTGAPSGIFTGTLTGLDVTTSTNQDAYVYYVVDTTKVIAIESDANQITLGYFEAQQ